MINFDGQTFFVTGGSRGIGAGIAKHIAEHGGRVAISYASNNSAAEKVLGELKGEGHMMVAMNLTDNESIKNAAAQILESFGKLDGLVNNAGKTDDQILLRMKPEQFEDVVAANLTGTFNCTKAFLKPMTKARKGSIVNITSVVGLMGNPGQSNYAASKAGITGFSKSVALEMASRNIRVNCVAPGYIATEMTEAMEDKAKDAVKGRIPMARMGQVEDIASAVSFLLCDQSQYITGHTLSVNGGMYL